jgi:rhamnosyltransferase
LFELARAVITDPSAEARRVDYHDWLIYAVARARGWGWHIDGWPSVDYRQHSSNAMGANVGVPAALARLKLIRERWHRGQAVLLARIGVSIAESENRQKLERVLGLLTARGVSPRLQLAGLAGQLRRRPRDRRIIGTLIATGVW